MFVCIKLYLVIVWDFPHFVIACEIYLFVAESKAFVTWFLLGVKTGCDYSYDSYICRVLFYGAF